MRHDANDQTNPAPHSASCTGHDTDALSQFLSNELSRRDAESLLSHLQTCAACQIAYNEMRVIQSGLRALPAPDAPYGGSEAARERVFVRVRRSVRVGETAPLQTASKPVHAPVRRPWLLVTSFASATAVCAVAGLVFLHAPRPIAVPAPAIQSASVGVPLPSPNEMAFLYQLHDAQHGGISGSTADPADRRDAAAEARAALLREAEPLADNGAL